MIDLSGAVKIFLFLLGGGLIFALMFWLTYYIGREFPASDPFMRVIRIVLAVLAVLVAIGFILNLMGVQVLKA